MATIGKTRKAGDRKHKWIPVNDSIDRCINCPVERIKVADGYEYLFVPGRFEHDTVVYAPPCLVQLPSEDKQ